MKFCILASVHFYFLYGSLVICLVGFLCSDGVCFCIAVGKDAHTMSHSHSHGYINSVESRAIVKGIAARDVYK